MPKVCNACSNNVFGGGFCKNHQYLRQDKKAPKIKPKAPTYLPRFSNKLRGLTKQYNFQRMHYLSEHPLCKAKLIGCKGLASEIHHMQGRGIYLLKEDTWLGVCLSCHRWIEMHPKEAKELHFSQSRL